MHSYSHFMAEGIEPRGNRGFLHVSQLVSVSPNPKLLTETLVLPALPSRGENSHSGKSRARAHAKCAICLALCALLPLQVP